MAIKYIDEGANFIDIGVLLSIHILQMVSNGICLQFASSATCATPQIIYTNGLTVTVKLHLQFANAGSDQIIYGTSTSLTANNAILE
jgi:hypothetical protein